MKNAVTDLGGLGTSKSFDFIEFSNELLKYAKTAE